MIIANLKGGLGNQMFQYALGRHLSIKLNTTFKLDIESLSKAKEIGNIYRPFDLANFNIKAEIATKTEVESLKNKYGWLSKVKKIVEQKILRRSNLIFNESILELKDNYYLDGYWQSPKYFDDIRDVLLSDFTLREPLSPDKMVLLNKIVNTNSVSLHIRRGDYVANSKVFKENGVCSVDYYQKALNIVNTELTDITVFVFSDDTAWVKENIDLPQDSIFVSETPLSTTEELYLMSLCKHNIIANSSFSWWGAWLNQNPNKIVIAPTPWFDRIKYDKDLVPKSWRQIQK